MEYTILVHYQFMPDGGKLLREKIKNYNSAASLVPNLFDKTMVFETKGAIFERLHPNKNYYSKDSKKSLEKTLTEQNIPVFVEGYRHCCESCFEEGKDPSHEYVCANGNAQILWAQKENTQKGIDLTKKKLGKNINIIGVCPPNHQGNWNTKESTRRLNLKHYVVRRGFDYPEDKLESPCLFDFPSWKEDNLIILPESKRVGKSPLFYVMYSDIIEKGWEEFEPIFENAAPLSEISIQKKPQNLAKWSEWFVWEAKKARDLKKRFS